MKPQWNNRGSFQLHPHRKLIGTSQFRNLLETLEVPVPPGSALLSCALPCSPRGAFSASSVSAAGCFTLLGFPCSSSANLEARLSFSPELCGRQSIGPSQVKCASWFSSDALRKYCVNNCHGLPVESLRTICLPGLLHSIGYVAIGECVGGYRYLSNNGK